MYQNCFDCGTEPATVKGYCWRCYQRQYARDHYYKGLRINQVAKGRICSACQEPVYALGLCRKCYAISRKNKPKQARVYPASPPAAPAEPRYCRCGNLATEAHLCADCYAKLRAGIHAKADPEGDPEGTAPK